MPRVPAENSDRATKLLYHLVLLLTVWYIVVFVAVAGLRLNYPFELEWMEGGAVDHVNRVLSGQKLYVSPSLEFTPFIYTPAYFYISAIAAKLLGVGFTPLRLVSLLSAIGCGALIFRIVVRETKQRYPAILAVGLFAAAYPLSGAWYDVARADSLFLLLTLGTVYVIRFSASWRGHVLAGLFMCLAFLTKQPALVVCLAIGVCCVIGHPRRSLAYLGSTVLSISGSIVLLNYIHEGWFSYYVFKLPSQHPLLPEMLAGYWTRDLMAPLAVGCLIALFYLFDGFTRSSKKTVLFYSFVAIGMLGASWGSRVHAGGFSNVLMPAYTAIAVLFGLGVHRALDMTRSASGTKRLLHCYVLVACSLQFLVLLYNPAAQIPTKQDAEGGRDLVDFIHRVPGDVFVPYHSRLPALAGKPTYAHAMAINDVLRGDAAPARDRLLRELSEAIRARRFDAIILDEPWFMAEIEEYYVRAQAVFPGEAEFWTVTGMPTRPQFVYVPRAQ